MLKIAPMFRGDQSRENREPASLDAEIVITASVFAAANLDDHQAAPFRSILRCELLQHQNAVRQALQLRVLLRASVIQQQGGAFAAREILLQGQDLSAITQRRLR